MQMEGGDRKKHRKPQIPPLQCVLTASAIMPQHSNAHRLGSHLADAKTCKNAKCGPYHGRVKRGAIKVTQVHLNKKTSTLSLIPQGGLCAARELCKCHSKAGSGAAHTSTHQRTPAHVSPLPPHVSPLSTYVIIRPPCSVLPACRQNAQRYGHRTGLGRLGAWRLGA